MMMNDAEKELREAMNYLDQARTNHDTIRGMIRALERGEAVEVTFRSAQGSVSAICPEKASEKLLVKLEQQAFARITNLEKQEVYWCQEVALLDKANKLNRALSDNPDASRASLEQQERERTRAMWAANDECMARRRGQGQVAGPPQGFGPEAATS